ncbi:MAG: LTA synthase family protein [Oscillospiraceae bacterium]
MKHPGARRRPGRERAVACSAASAFAAGWVLTAVSELITTQSFADAAALLFGFTPRAVATAAFLGLVICTLGFLCRSIFAGGLIVTLSVAGLSFANYYKMLITSTPLYVQDIRLVTQVGGIMELNEASMKFSGESAAAVVIMLLVLVGLFFVSRRFRPRLREGLISGLISAILFASLFCVPASVESWFYGPAGSGQAAAQDTQIVHNSRCGVLLGLWRSVVLGGEESFIPEPDEEELMLMNAQSWIEELPDTEKDEQPNVIFVLGESFFDVTELPGVSYAEDPVADFHRICSEGVSGKFYTHTLGYGTENIELEIMTGINTRFFSWDDMIYGWEQEKLLTYPSLPQLFSDAGYYTAYLHTFNDGIYNRTALYTALGFQDMYFSGDFAAIDPEAAAAPDYWGYMYGKIAGEFYSDDYLADVTAELFDQKAGEGPVFLWAVTMENHTPYTADKFSSYDFPFESELGDEAVGVLNAVTQGVADCSEALGKLVDHLAAQDEPVIVVFFGDHRPGTPLESGATVYSELGMCPEDVADWELEDYAELYSTDYVIWSNDPSLLPAEPGSRMNTSSTLLGVEALQLAGIDLDEYWSMCAVVDTVSDGWTWNFFVPQDGEPCFSPFAGLDEEGLDIIQAMRVFMNSTFYGTDGPDFRDIFAGTERDTDTK